MTARERFRKTLNFEKVDRMPIMEWAPWWDTTVNNWKAQGLVFECQPPLSEGQSLQKHFGLDLLIPFYGVITTDETPAPAYHGAPLARTAQEYRALKRTLYPDRRFDPAKLKAYAEYQARGEAVIWLVLEGPFWGPRVLLGIEHHLLAFYDQPELIHEINDDITQYHLRVIDEFCQVLTPDFMTFAEDMSYNNGPMLSEAMFDEFLLPHYRVQTADLKRRGIRVIVDSDGDIEMALPWFERAGAEGILPLERQAGVDLLRLRERHPNFLFIGHFDKMVMHLGETAIRAEFERLLPVMRQGGFIASVDHQTPPGVSLADYEVYLRLLKEYAGRV